MDDKGNDQGSSWDCDTDKTLVESLLKVYSKDELSNGIDVQLSKINGIGGEGAVISHKLDTVLGKTLFGKTYAIKLSYLNSDASNSEIVNQGNIGKQGET